MSTVFIWGKSDNSAESINNDERRWLPLWMHLRDTRDVSIYLWEHWVPARIKHIIISDLRLTDTQASSFLSFLAGIHDIGKATPDFSGRASVIWKTQNLYLRMTEHGYDYESFATRITDPIRHEDAALYYLKDLLKLRDRNMNPWGIAAIICGHHGSPRNLGELRHKEHQLRRMHQKWKDSGAELIAFIMKSINGIDGILELVSKRGITTRSQILLTSLVIMSDWIASDQDIFPAIDFSDVPDISENYQPDRVVESLARINLPKPFDGSQIPAVNPSDYDAHFVSRFDIDESGGPVSLYPSQRALIELVSAERVDPHDIFILEAQMGDGKTEAALLASESLMRRTSASGLFFGLPTMATTEAIFGRNLPFIERLLHDSRQSASVTLTHSKAFLSNTFEKSQREARLNKGYGIVDMGWLYQKRTKQLASFVTGTIDNFLMLSLKMPYAYWRHLGLASKVLIIDEVHSADEYMREYLNRSLEWAGFYGCPVILLSATLTEQSRTEFVNSYALGKRKGAEIG